MRTQHINAGNGYSVSQRFEKAQQQHGADKLFKYHVTDANCQKFVLWFLGSPSDDVRKFVEQDVAKSLENMGLLKNIANTATTIAAAGDILIHGKGQ